QEAKSRIRTGNAHFHFVRRVGNDFTQVNGMAIGSDRPENVGQELSAKLGWWVHVLQIRVDFRIAILHLDPGFAVRFRQQDRTFHVDASWPCTVLKINCLECALHNCDTKNRRRLALRWGITGGLSESLAGECSNDHCGNSTHGTPYYPASEIPCLQQGKQTFRKS